MVVLLSSNCECAGAVNTLTMLRCSKRSTFILQIGTNVNRKGAGVASVR